MATALVWAAVAVSGWYWTQVGLAAGGPSMLEAPPITAPPEISRPMELARLLGAAAPVAAGPGPGPADRFILSGVIASLVGQGAALISVDGKPARPFAVGTELAPGYVLVSVAPREAMLAEGLFAPVRAVLSLPLQSGASTVAPARAPVVPITPGIPSAATPSPASVPSVAPAVAPAASAPLPTPVPARADSRRQPQTSLRRDERRTP
jgi:general secretion pathway protein C